MLTALIPEPVQRRIRQFVDDVFLPRAVTISPGAPADMIDGPPNESGWRPWKPVESPVADSDILALEADIGEPLPPLFRAWLMYRCLLMTDFGTLSLPETPSNDPLAEFRRFVSLLDSQPMFRKRGVVPFASDGDGIGPLCFDFKRRLPDGDCPVLLFDHELLSRPDYLGMHFAESFSSLLDRLEAEMRSYDK